MNSHIYWMRDFLQPNVPNEFPIEYNSCMKSFQRSIEWSDLLQCSQWTFGALYQVFEVDFFEHSRFCDEFSHLLNARFVAALCTKWIPKWIQFMFEKFSTFYWMVRLITMLSMNLWSSLSSVWSRFFWAFQILWWILTSTECTICCSLMHLMNSQLNTIHVWNIFAFYWIVWLITMLSMNLWSSLSSAWSRFFEHSRFCDEFSHLLNARFVAALCT